MAINNIPAVHSDEWEQLHAEYEEMCKYYGIRGSWNNSYGTFSCYMWCPQNRRIIIGMYLTIESQIQIMKEWNERHPEEKLYWFYGIDNFLKEYKDAVNGALNLDLYMLAFTFVSCLLKGGMASRDFYEVIINEHYVACYREVGSGNPEYKGEEFTTIQLDDLDKIYIVTQIDTVQHTQVVWERKL